MVKTDVLVIGAGPAGSAAARVLASEGAHVLLADRHRFPRDKVCGDALIPDALQALSSLGLTERVASLSHASRAIRIYSPDGAFVTVPGDSAVLPRALLDEILVNGAIQAGARFLPHLRAVSAIESGAEVRGATFVDVRDQSCLEVRARTTILATGADGDALKRFGVTDRPHASAMAARFYVKVPPAVARDHDFLAISYAAAICPGYGWLFPGPDGIFNVGIGYLSDARLRREQRNLRVLLREFIRSFAPARELVSAGQILTPLKGAPLRTGLRGSRLSRPGLLVAGEAAATTYSFTGEGIGKALQSGIAAARTILDGARGERRDAAEIYAQRIRADFGDRFAAYQRLERLLSYPPIVNLMVRRANAGRYVRAQLDALVNETGHPDGLVSPFGAVRALFS